MKIKYFIFGSVFMLVLNIGFISFGYVTKKIDITFDSIIVKVNGKNVSGTNLLYNGTTYVPLRAISEMLGKNVSYDSKTRVASITDKVITSPITFSNFSTKSQYNFNYLYGEVKNNDTVKHSISYNVNFYDSTGKVLDQAVIFEELEPGETKTWYVMTESNYSTYKVEKDAIY